jgi:hypothetical protein
MNAAAELSLIARLPNFNLQTRKVMMKTMDMRKAAPAQPT